MVWYRTLLYCTGHYKEVVFKYVTLISLTSTSGRRVLFRSRSYFSTCLCNVTQLNNVHVLNRTQCEQTAHHTVTVSKTLFLKVQSRGVVLGVKTVFFSKRLSFIRHGSFHEF